MRQSLSTEAMAELSRSTLHNWVECRTKEAELAVWSVPAAIATAVLFGALYHWLRADWTVIAAFVAFGLIVLCYSILVLMHKMRFESALADDHLLPESEKALVKVRLLVLPGACGKLARRLAELAEARVVDRGGAAL